MQGEVRGARAGTLVVNIFTDLQIGREGETEREREREREIMCMCMSYVCVYVYM